MCAAELGGVTQSDASAGGAAGDDRRPPTLGEQVRIAFREDPTKGLYVLLLFLLGFGFLVAGVVVFWDQLLEWFLGLF